MSHNKNRKSQHSKMYEYRIISSRDMKKRGPADVEGFLNALGAEGWDLVVMTMNESNGKGASLFGLMKRRLQGKTSQALMLPG